MTYSVKEVYYTLQGEGAQAGLVCAVCDTDFCGQTGRGCESPELTARFVASR